MATMIEATALSDLLEDTQTQQEAELEGYGDPEDQPGWLLSLPKDAKLAERVAREFKGQEPFLRRTIAQWRVNELRRKGIKNVKLTKDPDRGWSHYVPPTATPDTIPGVSKAATLCRRTTALLFSDPPMADPVPASGEEVDVAAAEMMGRILEDVQSPSQLNTQGKARRAFDRGATTGSGFVRYYMDPKGGGRQPVTVMASPQAPHVDQAARNELGIPWGDEPVRRYVRQDGTLTDEVQEAATRWVPGIRSEVVTGRNLRLLPHTADDIEDAEGAIFATFKTWRELKGLYEELGKLDPSQRDELLRWKPDNHEEILAGAGMNRELEAENNPDESLCCVLEVHMRESPEYPQGARVVIVGGKLPVVQEEWGEEMASGAWETFHLPYAQFAHFEEGDEGPYKHGMMEVVGSGDELRAAMFATYLDFYEALNNRATFIPTSSILRPEQLRRPGKKILPINMGGQPFFEEVPNEPRAALEAYQLVGTEMDNASGIEGIAQGLQDPSVQSGRHAYAIISQVHAALSELKENVEKGYIRCCQIEMQLLRAYYDTPRQLEFTGDDGEHRQQAWSNADLKSTRDVKIKAGTMTMLSSAAKADLAEKYAQLGFLQPHELRSILARNVGGTVGLQDDEHLMRIKRQIGRWYEGPSESFAQVAEQLPPTFVDPMTGQRLLGVADVVSGEVIPAQPPQPAPLHPELAGIFDPLPCDEDPSTAGLRYTELARLMASKRYKKWPPEWRVGVDVEFQRMRRAIQAVQQAAPPPQPKEQA